MNIDHLVEFERHSYSVPYTLTVRMVEIRATASTVENYRQGQRVASHPRSTLPYKHTTTHVHRPKAHQRHLDWPVSRIIKWTARIGPKTAKVLAHILYSDRHPEQSYRSCLGIVRLGEQYPHPRVEAAAARASALNVCSYQSLRSILEQKLDGPAPEAPPPSTPPLDHLNLRGPGYYGAPLPQTSRKGPHANRTHSRLTHRLAPARHGRSLPRAAAKRRRPAAEL